MSSGNEKATAKETIVNFLEALRLKGAATHHFIDFKQLRDVYERQIGENGKQMREEIAPGPYKT